MIFTKKVFWFKTIRYVLEPCPNVEELKKYYSAIYIFSYDKKKMDDFSLKHKKTPIINLEKDVDEIFRGFNKTTRNEIRKTLDGKIKGLEIVPDDKSLMTHYRLSKEFEYAQGRVPERMAMYEDCRLFGAYYNHDLISSVICFENEKVLRAKVICSKRLTIEDKNMYNIISYATRRLIFEVCRFGHNKGKVMFDLGSVNFSKKKLAQFKMNFTQHIIDEYTYTYKSKMFTFFEKGVGIKKLMKKWLKF